MKTAPTSPSQPLKQTKVGSSLQAQRNFAGRAWQFASQHKFSLITVIGVLSAICLSKMMTLESDTSVQKATIAPPLTPLPPFKELNQRENELNSLLETETEFGTREELVQKIKHLRNQALHSVIDHGEFPLLVAINIENGASPHALEKGISPLYRACEKGNLEIIKILLEKGADVNQHNDFSGEPPPDLDNWEALLARKKLLGTPMHAAAIAGNPAIVDLLIEHGASIDTPNSEGKPPLFLAVQYYQEKLALYLIEKGANIRTQDRRGTTLIELAVGHGQTKIVEKLFNEGVPLHEYSDKGYNENLTLLHLTALNNNPETLKFLLDHGGSEVRSIINIAWIHEYTPLALAIQASSLECVKLLVEAQASLSMKFEKLNMLELAWNILEAKKSEYQNKPQNREEGIVQVKQAESIIAFLQPLMEKQYISTNPAQIQALHLLIDKGYPDLVRTAFDFDISLSGLEEGISPLYRACMHGYFDIAKMLLNKGANPNQRNDLSQYKHLASYEERHNATPLKAARASGNQNLVDLLLERGAKD